MNKRQLEKIGIPGHAAPLAVQAIQELVRQPGMVRSDVRERMRQVAESPGLFVGDPILNDLARELLESDTAAEPAPITYRTWGRNIDDAAHGQMRDACQLPAARGAALMPDAHVGYGLPIGGVLAMENQVIPYAVGVDIACRMKLSVLDMPPETLTSRFEHFRQSLENGTRFGVGSTNARPQDHPVMDDDWSITRITRQNQDKARKQLGTSGSGNHFVEFGTLTLTERCNELDLDAGTWVALLSHSGSRGTGASVCSTYSAMARRLLKRSESHFGRLAWLDMNSAEGRDYWAAMSLMGRYAEANHAVIHRLVTQLLGARVIAGVENHHNFAWRERHGGRDVIVHRKGATPAGRGVLGVIPGSMASPAYVVRGKGNPESLMSAAHGAGRCMSRTKAKSTFRFRTVQRDLARKGITVLAAGSDEVPGVYKDIEQVMREQQDLVDAVARFDPKIVRMCGDGSKAED